LSRSSAAVEIYVFLFLAGRRVVRFVGAGDQLECRAEFIVQAIGVFLESTHLISRFGSIDLIPMRLAVHR
jgi:hypothetical protein